MVKTNKGTRERTWNLANDITLTISFGRPVLTVAAIESFLSGIVEYFKNRRDDLHEEIYKEGPPPVGYATHGRKFYGNCFLAHRGDEAGRYLPTDSWVRALISAQCAADTVTDIITKIDSFKVAIEDGWLKTVIAALDKPNGDLDAFEIVLNHVNEQPGTRP